MTTTRKWSLLAVILIVAIFVAGWMLLISPKRSEAADLHQQADVQQAANVRLTQQLEVLKAQQADLPKQQARLATLKTQIPKDPALPSLIRSLTSSANKVGVTVVALAPQPPVAVVSAPAGTVASTTTSTTSSESGTTSTDSGTASTDSGTDAAAPAAKVTVAAPSLYQVPLEVDLSGSYFELEQFVNKLEGLQRAFLVTGFTLGEVTDAEAAPGDLSLKLTGQVFLSPPAAAATPTTPVATAPAGE